MGNVKVENNSPDEPWVKVREAIVQHNFEDAFLLAEHILAISEEPQYIVDFIQILLKLKKYHDAEIWLKKLSSVPQARIDYHLLTGHLFYKKQQNTEARAQYQQVLKLNPKHFTAQYNLGLLCALDHNFDQACSHFKTCLSLSTSLPPSFNQNYAMALLSTQQPHEASIYLMRAAQTHPNAEVYFHLGLCHQLKNDSLSALECYEMALSLENQHIPSLHNKVILLLSLNQKEAANEVLSDLHRLQPNDRIIQTLSDALGPKTLKSHHSTFVKTLFDQYAFNYDEHLQATLAYDPFTKARELMNTAVDFHSWQCGLTLDLGCGSGLAAPFFIDLCAKIIGIDLSEGMLLQAKRKQYYDELVCEDVLAYLEKSSQVYQLILAFEISNYLGHQVQKLVDLCAKKMLPQGLIVITFEKNIETNEPIELNNHIRFSFTQDAIENLFEDSLLSVLSLTSITLRKHQNTQTPGFLVIAQKQ